MEELRMNYESLEAKLIQQQNQYIQELEGQLDIYKEKDKAQEKLIQTLNEALELFAGEISRLKAEKDGENQKGQ